MEPVPMNFEVLVNKSRSAFLSGKTRSLKFRTEQIKRLSQCLLENYDEIQGAVARDFGKPKADVSLYELDVLVNYLDHVTKNLKEWTKPVKAPMNLLFPFDEASISKQPYGVVLVLGTWNFPAVLSLHPFIGAIAAGNTVILKPSEVAHHTATVILKHVPRYLDSDCYHVIGGDAETSKQLLRLKFDMIFCTGSTQVGKYVMEAAAKHLTPVTLELGGKSPCYVDESADLDLTARRIIYGKMVNTGQACVSPDYVLCSRKVEGDLVRALKYAMRDIYGPEKDLQRSPDIGRIINEKHTLRLKRLLEKTRGRIVYGGQVDLEDLWVQPTIVVDVDKDDVLMEEEIFGPILPIVRTAHVELAVDFIQAKKTPLCLYIFSKKASVSERLMEGVQSGSVCVNDTAFHCINPGIPFGGIGESGMGSTGQGFFGVDAFSHKRGVVKRTLSRVDERVVEFRYPPLTRGKVKATSMGYKYYPMFYVDLKLCFRIILAFLAGVTFMFLLQ